MIVKIPVAPISRKIILTERGGEPIHFTHGDIYFQIIHFQRKEYRGDPVRLQQVLTEEVDIIINDNYYSRIQGHELQIGYHLLNYHYDRLEHFVWASKLAGRPATRSIDRFYQIFGIMEDDYSRQSAYKRWQRFLKKKNKENSPNFFKNLKRTVLPELKPQKDIKDIHLLAGKIIAKNTFLFVNAAGNWDLKTIRDLHIFLSKKHQMSSVEEIATQHSISPRSVYYGIRKIQDLLHVYELEISA